MKTIADLQAIRDQMRAARAEASKNGYRVLVGLATCGIAAGARPVMDAINEEVAKNNLKNVIVSQTGCIGICQYEPVVEVYNPDGSKVTYVKMTAEKAAKVVADHLVNGNIVTEYTIGSVAK